MNPIAPGRSAGIRLSVPAAILAAYIVLHIVTLARHPFVHSDEAWLAILSRAMMANHSLAATEEVFRLTPRYPHALKTLYHLIQMPFLAVSWSAWSARMPSLLSGLAALFFITRIAGSAGLGARARWVPAAITAMDPQFWYTCHLGRQEMMLIALFLFSWYLWTERVRPLFVALPLAAAIFIHPNAFILSLPIGAFYLAGVVQNWKTLPDLAIFIGVLAAAAVAALGLSLKMDPFFLRHYRDFGDAVGVGDSPMVKILGLPVFLGKIWTRHRGTYYLPDARGFMVSGALGFLLTALTVRFPGNAAKRQTALSFLVVLPAILFGMVVVGKYAPPTAAFLMAPSWLLLSFGVFSLTNRMAEAGEPSRFARRVVAGVFLLIAAYQAGRTYGEVLVSWRGRSYKSCVEYLQKNIDDEGRILANLNTAFAFGYDRLVIWRDLQHLPDEPAALNDFLIKNGVRWVVLSPELKLIYESRPVWNNLYGNPRWYPELERIIGERGVEVSRAVFPEYAMRIVPLMSREEWELQVVRLDEPPVTGSDID